MSKKATNEKLHSKIIVSIFVCIVSFPLILGGLRTFLGFKFDVKLKGFSASTEKSELTKDSFLSGDYQQNYTKWYEETMPLRGVYVRNYNTLQYFAFHAANRPIGKNGHIFEPAYLNAELGLNEYDYSTPENVQKMDDMVCRMESVQEKLKKYNKSFFVYISPSKAAYYSDSLPGGYVAISDKNAVRAFDLFCEKMKDTDIPYLICEDKIPEMEYPVYYKTGIHWSRTYEQKMSQEIIRRITEISDGNYRNFETLDTEKNKEGFWRDKDVYDLLNVWIYPDIDYYQYRTLAEEKKNAEPLNILIEGDSFAEGLKTDIESNLKEDSVFFVNRNTYVINPDQSQEVFSEDWNAFDMQKYVDQADCVVLEMTHPEIIHHGYGFLEALDEFLNTYEPKDKSAYYVSCLNAYSDAAGVLSDATWDTSACVGVYGKEENYAWLQPESKIILSNKDISAKGLEFDYCLPQQVFENGETDTVSICVNGNLVFDKTYDKACADQVIIDASEFEKDDEDVYVITISAEKSYNPYERGENEDDRDLAILLQYIGGIK